MQQVEAPFLRRIGADLHYLRIEREIIMHCIGWSGKTAHDPFFSYEDLDAIYTNGDPSIFPYFSSLVDHSELLDLIPRAEQEAQRDSELRIGVACRTAKTLLELTRAAHLEAARTKRVFPFKLAVDAIVFGPVVQEVYQGETGRIQDLLSQGYVQGVNAFLQGLAVEGYPLWHRFSRALAQSYYNPMVSDDGTMDVVVQTRLPDVYGVYRFAHSQANAACFFNIFPPFMQPGVIHGGDPSVPPLREESIRFLLDLHQQPMVVENIWAFLMRKEAPLANIDMSRYLLGALRRFVFGKHPIYGDGQTSLSTMHLGALNQAAQNTAQQWLSRHPDADAARVIAQEMFFASRIAHIQFLQEMWDEVRECFHQSRK